MVEGFEGGADRSSRLGSVENAARHGALPVLQGALRLRGQRREESTAECSADLLI